MSEISHYVAYDDVGRIVFSVNGPEEICPLTMQINGYTQYARIIWTVDPQEYYAPEGKLQLRPASTAVLEGNLLRGVPEGAQVTIEGQVYSADGTDIELNFEYPGTYSISVDAFPQRAWTGEYVED